MLEHDNIHGSGRLEFHDDLRFGCTFVLHQHYDGALFLDCDCSGGDVAASIRLAFSVRQRKPLIMLIGETRAGKSIRTVGPLQVSETNDSQYTFRATQVIVGDETLPPTEQRFILTNLSFPERGSQDIPDPVRINIHALGKLITVVLEPHEEYWSRERVQRQHGLTAPTAILTVASVGSIAETSEVVKRLCIALSIVQGHKINWITHECYNADHESCFKSLEDRVTKGPSSLALNRLCAKDRRLPMTAVQDCYTRVSEIEERYSWERVLEVWLEARSNSGYLETRALKFVVALEALRTITLRREPRQPLVAASEWDTFLTYLIPIARSYLTEDLKLKQDQVNRITAREVWKSLNGRSFRSDILATFKILGVKEDNRAIELFVNSRNKLIHEGAFRCQSEPQLVALESDAPKSPIAEYVFIASFVDRVIMQTAGLQRYLSTTPDPSVKLNDS
jgi:hypothetical protein